MDKGSISHPEYGQPDLIWEVSNDKNVLLLIFGEEWLLYRDGPSGPHYSKKVPAGAWPWDTWNRTTVTMFLGKNKLSECDCGGEKANTTHSDWCSKS